LFQRQDQPSSSGLFLKQYYSGLFPLFFNTNQSQISEHILFQRQFKIYVSANVAKHMMNGLRHGWL